MTRQRVQLLSLLLVSCGAGVTRPAEPGVWLFNGPYEYIHDVRICDHSRSFTVLTTGLDPISDLNGGVTLPTFTVTRRGNLAGTTVEPSQVAVTVTPDCLPGEYCAIRSPGAFAVTFDQPPVRSGFYEVAVTSPLGGEPVLAKSLLEIAPPPVFSTPFPPACLDDSLEVVEHGDHIPRTAPNAFDCQPDALGGECRGTVTHYLLSGAGPVPSPGQSWGQPSMCDEIRSWGEVLWLEPSDVFNVMNAPSASGHAQTLTLNGVGLIVADGLAPTVRIGDHDFPSQATSCTPVNPREPRVLTCSRLTVEVPNGTLPTGEYVVSVSNPAVADCLRNDVVRVALP